jgi:hypothetical protein
MLELLWCCVVVVEALSTSVTAAQRCYNRTEDYQQTGYENHLTSSCLCQEQTLYRVHAPWISGIVAQLLDRAPLGQVKNFSH